MLCDSLADLCVWKQILQILQTTIQTNIIIGPNLQVKKIIIEIYIFLICFNILCYLFL